MASLNYSKRVGYSKDEKKNRQAQEYVASKMLQNIKDGQKYLDQLMRAGVMKDTTLQEYIDYTDNKIFNEAVDYLKKTDKMTDKQAREYLSSNNYKNYDDYLMTRKYGIKY